MAKIRRMARLVQRGLQHSATLPPVAPLYQPVILAELASKFRRTTQTKTRLHAGYPVDRTSNKIGESLCAPLAKQSIVKLIPQWAETA